jgi:hypothetical protein
MNKKLFPFFTILMIAALGAFAAHFLSPRPQSVPETGMPAAASKSYASAQYGFSFSYPADYIVDEYESGTPERARHSIVLTEDTETSRAIREGRLMETEGPTAITIDVFQNLENGTAQSWVSGSAYSNLKQGSGTYEAVSLAGTPAVHYFWDGLYRGESIVLADGGNILMLSVTYLEPADRIRADFASVIGSFAFVQ